MFNKVSSWINKLYEKQKDFEIGLNSQSLDQAIITLESVQKICWIAPLSIWGIHLILLLLPVLNTLDFQAFMLLFFLVLILNEIAVLIINRELFYFNTRQPKLDPKEKVEVLWKIQKTSDMQSALTEGAIWALPITFTVLPYIQFLRLHPTVAGWTVAMTDSLNGNPYILRIVIMTLPVIGTLFLYQWQKSQEQLQKQNIEKWMKQYHHHDPKFHAVLSGVPDRNPTKRLTSPEPYMILGKSIMTGDAVELAPVNRKQNSVYFGPVGAGKTSTIFIPQIKQDIDYLLKFIRDFPKISKDPDFFKEKDNIATHYLNGFCVIETSNDLCTSIYNMAIKLGVPKDMIYWLDPTNASSVAMNLLRGPLDTVVQSVINIVAGQKAVNDDFFKQSERTHLTNFVILLKLTCIMEDKIATFPDLMDLYNDIYVVVDKMKVLDQYVAVLNTRLDEAKSAWEAEPDDDELKKNYQELFDKYDVAYNTAQWFHNTIKVATFGQGVLKQKSGPHEGEVMWVDEQAENVQGLKNTLGELSRNRYLRRILFRDSEEFNFDDVMRNGGIILCNTAKAELQDQLATRLGQIYLNAIQAATFRRANDRVPMFPLYADEFPDFVSEAFKSFIAQARKYNVTCQIAAQSPSQLSFNFGQDFFNTLMTNMLTRGTFGDLGAADAKLLEPYFGEKTEVEENQNEQQIDLIADQNSNRRMISSRRQTVPNISAAEIMALPKFTIALRHPGPQGSEMFDLIKTDYLTDKDFINDPNVFDIHDSADSSAYTAWRNGRVNTNTDFDDTDLEIIDEVRSGQLKVNDVNKMTISTKTQGGDADDDLRNSHKVTPKKDKKAVAIQNKPNLEESKEDTGKEKSDLEKANDFFNQSSGTQGNTFFDDDDDDAGPTFDPTVPSINKEEAKQLVSEAVHKALDHGGNNRLNNNVEVDDDLPEVTPNKLKNYQDSEINQKSKVSIESNQKPMNDTFEKNEKDDNMLIQKDGKLLESKKDRDAYDLVNRKNGQEYSDALKKQILSDLTKRLNSVASDVSLTNREKVEKLTQIRDESIDDVKMACDSDKATRVIAKINQSINTFRQKEDTPQTIGKYDSLETMMQKSREVGSNSELSDELAKMLDQFDNDNFLSSNDSFDTTTDRFTHQHGMDD